jgi:peptide/nickel transport system substrate-binding protein
MDTMPAHSLFARAVAASIAGAAFIAATVAPSAVQAQGRAKANTIVAVKHSDLRVLDPILTTAYMSRNHGYMIFDTLFATNAEFEVTPQMVDTWKVSDDKLTYTFALRDGLKWHDGQPVTAEDCVASIERWGKRDAMGQKLMQFTKSLEAVDAKTIRLVLKEPYGLVLESLGKVSSNVPFMMPKRLAQTPPNEAIPEQIGSGPFKWVAEEFKPGIKAVYVKNPDYKPRSEPASWGAGGKVVKVDRVEWVKMPDHMTAVNALIAGEIDYIEQPPVDLLPLLTAEKDITVENLNKLGYHSIIRMNWLHPPFDNVKIRQAVLQASNQEDVMKAMIGNPEYYQICGAMFVCGTPLETNAGAVAKPDFKKAQDLLKEGGYDGTPIVLMHPTDVATLSTQPTVVAQALRRVGFKVDLQAMDWQTLVTRRASQEPPSAGGWNMFITNWVAADIMNPLVNLRLVSTGKQGGWFGWSSDPEMEKLRDQFARTTDPAEQKRLATAIQQRAYEQVHYVPLGQYYTPTAYRKNLSGVIEAPVPFFWNIAKK